MLVIQEIDVLDKSKLNIIRRKSKKKQIILYDTQRRIEDFVNKIKYRRNGKYDDIPHFIVNKMGVVFQVFDTNFSSKTFEGDKLNRSQIKIAIENLGWLNKDAVNGLYTNWIDSPYRSEPFIKGWRNYFYWDKYKQEQIEKVSELCEMLCEKHNIPKQHVQSQGYFQNVTNFKGIVCKSNFSNIYTDINPSFDFTILFNHAK
jgi:N-acetyl-anhydromuramyl-L-alanine amidase AmpD